MQIPPREGSSKVPSTLCKVCAGPANWPGLRPRSTDIGPAAMTMARFACRRQFGYRRLHLLLKREGCRVTHKKLFRIYREEKLVIRKRGGRKRTLGVDLRPSPIQSEDSRLRLTSTQALCDVPERAAADHASTPLRRTGRLLDGL